MANLMGMAILTKTTGFRGHHGSRIKCHISANGIGAGASGVECIAELMDPVRFGWLVPFGSAQMQLPVLKRY
jgi:hypothetical protein